MKDHRIVQNGSRLDYTCENSLLKTDITSGYPHRPGNVTKGSVTANPLYDGGSEENSLWLEYTVNGNGLRQMWFMWYTPNGVPAVPMSGVFDEESIVEVIRNIQQIKF